jgi:hypothetical protein
MERMLRQSCGLFGRASVHGCGLEQVRVVDAHNKLYIDKTRSDRVSTNSLACRSLRRARHSLMKIDCLLVTTCRPHANLSYRVAPEWVGLRASLHSEYLPLQSPWYHRTF